MFAAFKPLSHSHFTIDIPRVFYTTKTADKSKPAVRVWCTQALEQTVSSLQTVFLACGRRPMIRAQNNSICRKLGEALAERMRFESKLYDKFYREDAPLLLIVDRWYSNPSP